MLPFDMTTSLNLFTTDTMQVEFQKKNSNNLYGSLGVCAAIKGTKSMASNKGKSNLLVRDYAYSIFRMKNPSLFAGMPEFKYGVSDPKNDNEYFDSDDIHNAEIEVLESPKHGKISTSESGFQEISYLPNSGYVGADRAVFLVKMGGYQIKVVLLLENDKHRC